MMSLNKKNSENKTFKKIHSFEKRKEEAEYIISKYPDKIPIIIERANIKNSENIPNIKKKKFLVPNDLHLSQLIYIVRRRINIEPNIGIYFFIDNELHPTGKLIKEIYDDKKDEDGFLYMTYSGESTFG